MAKANNKKNKEFELLSMFADVQKESRNMVNKKIHDYGAEPLLFFKDYGCLVRATDKVMRLNNLYKNKKPKVDESIEDSWMDLANYCNWAIVLRRINKKCAD